MAVIAACVALVLLGVQLVVHRGGAREEETLPLASYIGASIAAGVAAGVLAAGAGGRLVMRLLAATSPDVHGSLTEAGEKVGEITVGGTVGFIFFAGVPAGLVSGALYALVAPVLPRGRAGGLALGVLLLVLAGTRIEPLRPDNFDFVLLDPAWLAVVGFSVLALFQGMLVAALAPVPPAASSRILLAGRAAAAIVLVAALPGFVGALSDLLSAG